MTNLLNTSFHQGLFVWACIHNRYNDNVCVYTPKSLAYVVRSQYLSYYVIRWGGGGGGGGISTPLF